MTGVSFVVPVYNKAPYLPAVLNAIFTQEGDFTREIIIVDDGSTDGSPAVIDRTCAGRTDTRAIHQNNQGQVAATNVGVQAATYPWIKFVDADDVLAPYATRILLDAAVSIGAKIAVGATTSYEFGKPITFGPLNAVAAAPYRRDLFREVMKNSPSNLSGTLIDRALYWEVGGGDPRLRYVIDTALMMRASRNRPVAGVRAVVAAGPSTAPNRMSANQARMLREHNRAMLYLLAENPDLSWRDRRLLLERAFGRAWKWQRRRRGASIWSRWFWLYTLAKIGPPALVERHLESTLEAFTDAIQ
ncbi:MAG: glycosyltransferase family 2 protein [Alphaproteobacteria bacterium]|nr:glycosyltransferase family 2 protein [Alphaproteobacteria bacterium]